MAYGQFTGYQDLGGGAYSFNTADGKNVTFMGDNAAELKQRIDASNSISQSAPNQSSDPNQSIAPQDSGSALSSVAPVNPVGSGAPEHVRMGVSTDQPTPAASPAAAPAPAPLPRPQYAQIGMVGPGKTMGVRQVTPAEVKARAAASGQEISDQDAATQAAKESAAIAANPQEGDLIVHQAGSAGAPAHWQATTQEAREEHKGGFEPDLDYLKTKGILSQEQLDSIRSDYANERVRLEGQRMNALANDQALQQQAVEAQNKKIAQDYLVDQKQQAYNNAVASYTNAKVDPDRSMDARSSMGAMLAAFGDALAGGHAATDMVNARINQDIDEQKRTIAVKGQAANNILQDLTRQLGSQDKAELALKDIRTQQAANYAEQQSLMSDPELANKYKKLAIDLGNQTADFGEQYRQKSIGEVTTATAGNQKFVPAQAASAPVDRLPTLEESGKATDLAGKRADVAKKLGSGAAAAGPDRSHPLEIHDATGKSLGFAASQKDATAVNNEQTAYNTYVQSLQRMRDLQQKGTGWLSKNTGEYEAARTAAQAAGAQLYGTSPKDVDLPGPNQLASYATPQIDQAMQSAHAKLQSTLNTKLRDKPPTMARGAGDKLSADEISSEEAAGNQ